VANGYQIDFLSFTLPSGHVPRAVKLLDKFDLKPQEKGLYGYKFSYVATGCRLLFSPDRSEVHVQLSGRGCDLFDCLALPVDAKVTRLDIAFDSFDGYYTVEDVWGCLLQSRTAGLSRSKTGYMGFDGSDSGRTVYIGSAKSDSRLRIYDKAAEQGIAADQRLDYADWTRYELQLRSGLADATYHHIRGRLSVHGSTPCNVLASVFAAILRPMFFITSALSSVDCARTSKKTIEPCPQWISMFSFYEVARPVPVRRAPTLSNLTRYVLGAASSIKALQLVFPSFDGILADKISEAEFNEKHSELLLEFAPYYSDSVDSDIAFWNLPF
jgi:hypothetical protein